MNPRWHCCLQGAAAPGSQRQNDRHFRAASRVLSGSLIWQLLLLLGTFALLLSVPAIPNALPCLHPISAPSYLSKVMRNPHSLIRQGTRRCQPWLLMKELPDLMCSMLVAQRVRLVMSGACKRALHPMHAPQVICMLASAKHCARVLPCRMLRTARQAHSLC